MKLFKTTAFLAALTAGASASAQEVEVVELFVFPQNQGRLSQRSQSGVDRLSRDVSDMEKAYNDFKADLNKKAGIQYSLDVSFLAQKGVPNGGKTAMQTVYAPSFSWQMFNNDTWGTGTLSASYTAVRYWGNRADNIGNRLYLANAINDFSTPQNSFDQLTYTHALFNNTVSLTIGQFPIYDFDGSQYGSNQQTGFINYALSQNASETYPIAGLGAYVQVNPTNEVSVAAGFQNARNVGAETLSGKGWGDHRFTSFGSISFTPTINGRSGQYSVLVYNQPNVITQPQNTTGWSVNISQNLTDSFGVFVRANAATGSSMPVKQSYVLGGVYTNPQKQSNQAGLAVAYNKVAKQYFAEPVRSFETVVEGYVSFGVTQFLTITPDIQLYVHPALRKSRNYGTVFSLRGTIQL